MVVDLGGVLFEFDHSHRLQVMSAAFGVPPERLHDLLWTSGFSADADAGRYTSAAEVRDRIRAITGFAGTDDDIDAAWCSAFRPDLKVRSALTRHHGSLTLFTNNGPLEEEVLRRRHSEMFDGFDQVLFSYRLGHSKPEPAAFEAVASQLGAAPEELVFVDDSPANTEMARRLGWTAYTFEGAETIERASARVHTFRPATHADLPGMLALLADEDNVVDPATVVVTEVYERAFAAIESDPRNELLVLADGTGAIVGCLQATYIQGSAGAASSGR